MKSMKLLCFVVTSNVASFAVTTLAVIYAWNSCAGSDSAAASSKLSRSLLFTERHRQAQECCTCDSSGPINDPTPAPFSVVSSGTFTCPSGEGSVDFETSGDIEFIVSSTNRLCTLVLIAPDQGSFKPIARSYDGYNWEASAGEFSTISWGCSGASCVATLPSIPTGAMYQLKSFDAPQLHLKEVDEIARFLEQTTFGPTRADIAKFDQYNLPLAFANYISAQQTTVPATSHRASYRQRMNANMEVATEIGAVTHPCQKGTRYRRYAFGMKDREKYMDITSIGNNRKMLSIDGFVRTIVSGPITDRWNSSIVFEDGSYQMPRTDEDNTYLGGPFYINHPAQGFELEVDFGGFLGNPSTEFDAGITPNVLLVLTTANAEAVDTEYFQGESVIEQELILTSDLSDAVCASLGESGNPINPVFATFGNQYLIHDPRFVTFENTVEDPARDGGGATVRQTTNIVEPELAAICSNAQRTFLNEDSCILSDDTTACEALTDDYYDEDTRPDFYIHLTPQTLRAIYEATFDRPEGPMYIYSIEGLADRGGEDKDIPLPCERATSRWVTVPCSDSADTLDRTMHEIFSELLLDDWDDNGYVRDIWNWYELECPAPAFGLTNFEINSNGTCYKNVHPDHLNVYDFTYWTLPSTHPGNIGNPDAIKEFAMNQATSLTFPDWHTMDRWSGNKDNFGYAGRLGDRIHYYDLPRGMRSQELNDLFGFTPSAIQYTDSKGVLVCGSPNEIANDLTLGGSQSRGAFDSLNWEFASTSESNFIKQKRVVWTEIALTADDQLRQRMAWALSQILVISSEAITDGIFATESMLNYYDIFVRNAFGNYRDVLKEVSYSPLMGDMLTYYGSQSTQYVWREYGNLEFADENFAREVMQLFTTGLFKLNSDGSQIIGANGDPERAYTNFDIVEYARVWTGFEARRVRGNAETTPWANQIDPMHIWMSVRDVYPKMGLDRTYIGDGYPLCADLPVKHFLLKGATYRLLGVNPTPELVDDPISWAADPVAKRVKLQPAGANSLFGKLCGSQNPSNCLNKAKIQLDATIGCNGFECSIDNVRVVEVGNGIFYEYVQPPCVHQAFFDKPMLVVRRHDWEEYICADPRTQVASSSCCDSSTGEGEWKEMYWGERTTLATAEGRCAGTQLPEMCNRWPRPSCDEDPAVGSQCDDNGQFWTSSTCTLKAKVDSDGNVAIVHAPNVVDLEPEAISYLVQSDGAKTFFRVDWDGDPGVITDNCAGVSTCSISTDGVCVCDVYVTDEQVFFDGGLPSRDDVLGMLSIGALDPNIGTSNLLSNTNGGVTRYTVKGVLTSESIFGVTDDTGMRQFRKNEKSKVHVANRNISFRNPVHFISFADAQLRDAEYETDAALDHYFYHPNTAPFLAIRFAQRFGISNPSPRYIEQISAAFRTGSYSFNAGGSTVSYGSGSYGDLGATVACVLLDREARTQLLDADPSHGAMKEPLIKIIGLMRSMEFELDEGVGFVDFDIQFAQKIGQMAHAIPNVFSFFLPEYASSGPVASASLVAPEAQVITGPRLIDTLNGILSLVKYGLSPCHGGLAKDNWWVEYDCDDYSPAGNNGGTQGKLSYAPAADSTAEEIVDELAALLTGGRLSLASREIIDDVVKAESNPAIALIKAQQLVALTPEFHSTNIVRKNGAKRPEPTVPPPSTRPYKAAVYVLLDGGIDSFNMLAPHSCSATNANGFTLLEQYYAERTSIAITEGERSRIINANDQPCEQFVIHQDLEIVERLYKSGDLSFFANAGVINKPVNKQNYYEETKTQLFAHNAMQEEAQKVDPFEGAPGTGVLGRMCDVLNRKGFNAQPITVEDATSATVGAPGASVDPLFVSPYDAAAFNPRPDEEAFDPRPYLDLLNDSAELQSSLFGETYSKRIQKALSDNKFLVETLATTQLNQQFADSEYSSKLQPVATLIASHKQRGTDRDVFYVSLGGWDNHNNLKASLANNFQELNGALTSFYDEMVSQGMWNDVSLVITSDFARTLTANSGEGSDHAWGGNYFMMGGTVKGGRIHGEYPADITTAGPYNIGRGRLIPTMSWESILTSVCEWMGLETPAEFDECLPNRAQTGTKLFSEDEVFDTPARSFWK